MAIEIIEVAVNITDSNEGTVEPLELLRQLKIDVPEGTILKIDKKRIYEDNEAFEVYLCDYESYTYRRHGVDTLPLTVIIHLYP